MFEVERHYVVIAAHDHLLILHYAVWAVEES